MSSNGNTFCIQWLTLGSITDSNMTIGCVICGTNINLSILRLNSIQFNLFQESTYTSLRRYKIE